VRVWKLGWVNRGYSLGRTILSLRPEGPRGVSAFRILVSRVKLRSTETGVNVIVLDRRKLTTVSAVCMLVFSTGDSTGIFNPIDDIDTQSRSARHEVLVHGRLNFKLLEFIDSELGACAYL